MGALYAIIEGKIKHLVTCVPPPNAESLVDARRLKALFARRLKARDVEGGREECQDGCREGG